MVAERISIEIVTQSNRAHHLSTQALPRSSLHGKLSSKRVWVHRQHTE